MDTNFISIIEKMLSKDTTKYIASLSRIHLEDQEVEYLTQNLGGILQYIEKLNKLDVQNIQPTSHVLPLKNVYREDEVKPSLSQADALKFSISQQNGFFKVPQVIE